MGQIKDIRLENGQRFWVEMEELAEEVETRPQQPGASRIPIGAEATGVVDDSLAAVNKLREHISAVMETVTGSLKDHCPDELTVELAVGFKGKSSPIPVLLSGEANGGIKITAKWKKDA